MRHRPMTVVTRVASMFFLARVTKKLAGDANQALREVGIDPPVARRVGVRQRVERYLRADPHVIELLGLRAQARFDVAQTLPEPQLREGHAQELVHAAEALHLVM